MRLRLRWPGVDLSREFLVDETPLPLGDPAPTGPGAEGVAQADLMTLAARAMVENERLQGLARDLAASARTDQQTLRLVRSLLPVLDSFDRVCHYARQMQMGEELANWLRSVEGVESRLLQALEGQGLEQLDPQGERVNLDRDDVVEYRRTDDHPGETVIEVRRKGYRFRGKTLREAQVVVANNTQTRG